MAAGTATLMCATVLPASANNVDLAAGPPRGPKYHHGLWNDLNDTLGACLGGSGTFYRVVIKISPADGAGPTFSILDEVAGPPCRYTGNLSIPEDERYIMSLTAYNVNPENNVTASQAFYT